MISSSLRIPEFDFLGRFGGRVRGSGGREVTTGSKIMLLARLSKDPLLLFSELPLLLFLDGLSSVVSMVEMVRGLVASLRSRLLEETMLLEHMLELELTRSSTVVGTA